MTSPSTTAPTVVRSSADAVSREPLRSPTVVPVPSGPAPRSVRQVLGRLRRQSAVLSVALAATALIVIGLQQHGISTLTTEVAPQQVANQRVLQATTDMETGLRGFALTGRREFLAPYDAAQPQLAQALATLRSADTDATTVALVQNQQRAIDAWRALTDPVAGAASDSRSVAERVQARNAFDQIRASNAALDQRLGQLGATIQQRAARATALAVLLFGLVGLVGMVLVRRQVRGTTAQVVPPLERLGRVVADLRRGRSTRADEKSGVAEIRTVASALNVLASTNVAQRDELTGRIALSEDVRSVRLRVRAAVDLDTAVDEAARAVAVGWRADTVAVRIFPTDPALPGAAAVVASKRRLDLPTMLFGLARRWVLAEDRPPDTLLITADTPVPAGWSATDHDVIVTALRDAGVSSAMLVPLFTTGPSDRAGYLAVLRGPTRGPWTGAEREALRRVGRDLGQIVTDLRYARREQDLLVRLAKVDRAKDEFIATASHELRSPLTAIIGHVQLIHHGVLGPVPAALAPSVAAIDRNSARLGRLIDDVLALSQLEGPLERQRTVDLAQLAVEVVDQHRPDAADRGITVALHGAGPVPVLGDAEALRRAMVNVLGNALKFSPPGSAVEVDLTMAADHAEINVSDHGLGISAADQQQLFTRFFRSTNPEALAVPGTGLGLTIVRTVLENHGGQIEVSSEPGVGTRVRMVLPLRAGSEDRLTSVGASSCL